MRARSRFTRVAPGPDQPAARSSRRQWRRQVDDGLFGPGVAPGPEQAHDRVLGVGEGRARGPRPRARRVGALCREDRRQRVDRRLPRVADADRLDTDRPPDRGRVAADLGAVGVEDGALVGVRLGVALAVPDVRVAGDDPERPLLAAAADEQRHPGLERRRVVAHLVAADPAALLGDRRAVEHPPGEPAGLVEPADPVAERQHLVAERAVLRLVPAGAQPEHRPAARWRGRARWPSSP